MMTLREATWTQVHLFKCRQVYISSWVPNMWWCPGVILSLASVASIRREADARLAATQWWGGGFGLASLGESVNGRPTGYVPPA